MVGYRERLADVRLAPELGEILSLEHIPVTVQHRPLAVLGQILERVHIIRAVVHQRLVVIHIRLNKDVVFRLLGLFVFAVDEQPLEPGMTDAAGVAGEVHPRREVLRHQAGRTVGFRHSGKHVLWELRTLLQKDNVIRLTLILEQVAVMPAVAELKPCPVGKDKRLVCAVVLGNAVQLTHRGQQMVFFQFGVRPAHEKHLNAVIAQA